MAGKGSRLYSLTKNIPKCLIQIGSTTILDRQINILQKNGINDIIVVAGYKIQLIKQHFKNKNIKIIYNSQYDAFDSLYSIICAKDFIKDSFVCLYGDLIFEEELLSTFLKSDKTSLIVDNPLFDYDSHSVTHKNNSINDINFDFSIQKPSAQFIGISKFSKNSAKLFKKILDTLKKKNDFDGEFVRVLKLLLEQKIKIYPFFVKSKVWININDEKKLKLAKTVFK